MKRRSDEGSDALHQLQWETDRLLLELIGADRIFPHAASAFRPKADVFFDRLGNSITVRLDLAGIVPEEVVLEARERMLLVRGRRPEQDRSRKLYQQMEIDYGPFERTLALPVDVDPNEATAHYEDGFLEIVLPVTTPKGAQSIRVNVRESGTEAETR